MAENKMEQVAALFGKKLGEEFKLRYKGKIYRAYFHKSGLRVRALYHAFHDSVLIELLTGEAVIVDD